MLSVGDMRTIGNFRREVTDAPQISDAQQFSVHSSLIQACAGEPPASAQV